MLRIQSRATGSKNGNRLLQAVFILLLCLLPLLLSTSRVTARTPLGETYATARVEQLISQMSTEQKVGQLFLVTFPADSTAAESAAAHLVRDLRVGGVVLRASNGNFVTTVEEGENQPASAASLTDLTTDLQRLAQEGSEAGSGNGPFVPLFTAVELSPTNAVLADGLPQDEFTPLPSQMAIGATWNPKHAEAVGQTIGQEMAAIGINMLLGPSLDVVNSPRPEQLGTRTFGENPYWVGKMGQAFVRGARLGSNGRVATVARHFPGLGSSDRHPDEEIATVQKSLQALQQEDLPPFFAVTDPGEPLATVDGLMTTNLRYRALQGNIRQITRPISLDATSLPALINQEFNQRSLQPWRQTGGILVSDELGAMSLRRFYAQQSDQPGFPARVVAEEAFKAGNDLLFLADFAGDDNWEARLQNIERTIQYFVEQYEDDPNFASHVDESLKRLLSLKLRLYDETFEEAVQPLPDPTQGEEGPLRSRENLNVISQITQEAVTLFYPGPSELSDRLPGPPLGDENLVIVTDARTIRDCPTCPDRQTISPNELQNRLLRLYGPESGSGRLNPDHITSLTFDQLYAFLTAEPGAEEAVPDLQPILEQANWIVFLFQNGNPEVASSQALSRFLREYGASTSGQKLIVYAFGAPYYLDSTEISKLTAYYGFYTPSQMAVELAARLLFKEFSASGVSPVTIESLQYELADRLKPDPNQLVQLCLDEGEVSSLEEEDCELPTSEEIQAAQGEIALRTSVIRDHNGNPVPDGTMITFVSRYTDQNNLEVPRQEVPTKNGIARAVIPLNLSLSGQLSISVVGETGSITSTRILIDIKGDEQAVQIEAIDPPTPTPSPSPTATPVTMSSPSPRPDLDEMLTTPAPTPLPITRFGQPNDGFGWWTFFVTLFGLVAVGAVGIMAVPVSNRVTLVRRSLLVALYGLVAYLLYLLIYAFRLLPSDFNGWGAIFLAIIAGFVGLLRDN